MSANSVAARRTHAERRGAILDFELPELSLVDVDRIDADPFRDRLHANLEPARSTVWKGEQVVEFIRYPLHHRSALKFGDGAGAYPAC